MNTRSLPTFVFLLLAGAVCLRSAEQKAVTTNATRPPPNPALANIDDVPGLPRVLILGDSISMGYTLPVRAALAGRANVHRAPENCSSTSHGLSRIERWLGDGKWDVIHFNFGLHDAKLPPEGVRHAAPEAYEQNLRKLVQRLRATGARLVWATTTPVPFGGILAPDRRFGDIAIYNGVARRVMKENGVAVNDLNAVIAPHLDRYARPRDLHFTTEGSALLAKHVVRSIELLLVSPGG